MIRKAEVKDINSIRLLLNELTGHSISVEDVQNRLEYIETSAIDSLYIYEITGKVVGLLSFRIRENIEENSRFGEISALVVDTSYRGKGIGKFLMEYAEKLGEENNCLGTWLVSGFGKEEQAHPFYKSLGYSITGYRFVKIKR